MYYILIYISYVHFVVYVSIVIFHVYLYVYFNYYICIKCFSHCKMYKITNEILP